jgi:hypothetical protein
MKVNNRRNFIKTLSLASEAMALSGSVAGFRPDHNQAYYPEVNNPMGDNFYEGKP